MAQFTGLVNLLSACSLPSCCSASTVQAGAVPQAYGRAPKAPRSAPSGVQRVSASSSAGRCGVPGGGSLNVGGVAKGGRGRAANTLSSAGCETARVHVPAARVAPVAVLGVDAPPTVFAAEGDTAGEVTRAAGLATGAGSASPRSASSVHMAAYAVGGPSGHEAANQRVRTWQVSTGWCA